MKSAEYADPSSGGLVGTSAPPSPAYGGPIQPPPPPPAPPGDIFVDNAYCPAFGSSQDPSIVGSYSLILDPAKGRIIGGS